MSYYTEFLDDVTADYLYCQRRPGFTLISQLPAPIKDWVQNKYPDTHWFRTGAIQGYPNTMLWWIGGWNLGEDPATRRTPDWEDQFVTQLPE